MRLLQTSADTAKRTQNSIVRVKRNYATHDERKSVLVKESGNTRGVSERRGASAQLHVRHVAGGPQANDL